MHEQGCLCRPPAAHTCLKAWTSPRSRLPMHLPLSGHFSGEFLWGQIPTKPKSTSAEYDRLHDSVRWMQRSVTPRCHSPPHGAVLTCSRKSEWSATGAISVASSASWSKRPDAHELALPYLTKPTPSSDHMLELQRPAVDALRASLEGRPSSPRTSSARRRVSARAYFADRPQAATQVDTVLAAGRKDRRRQEALRPRPPRR